MPFVNEYLTFWFITGKESSPREFTDSVARAMCAKMEAGGGAHWGGAERLTAGGHGVAGGWSSSW
jgi:hypothetical protein